MHKFLISFFLFTLLFPASVFAVTPNDPLYPEQWYLPHVDADDAWGETVGTNAVVIAVLDSGFDLDHPDLAQNIWTNSREIADNGLDDDRNGFVDDIHGWDMIENDNDPSPDITRNASEEAILHGSVVAGILGAHGDNNEGVTGVNWQVSVMPVRTLDRVGAGSSFETAAAVDYAVENGADVINLSFSGMTDEGALKDAVRRAYNAGVVVVAAMGNESTDADFMPVFPACFGDDEMGQWVIGVASTSHTDELSSFSNYGSICTDLSAPGEEFIGLRYHDPANGFVDKYGNSWSGTSMAAPVVSGTAGLVLSLHPDLTPEEVATVLKLSVDPVVTTAELQGKLGAGRVNIAKALEIAGDFSTVQEDQIEQIHRYISGESFSTAYAIDSVNGRRVFLDTQTYFTYEDSFSAVETVADEDLASYPLTGVVLPKAGVVLVKIQSDPRVYALEENADDPFTPNLQEIKSEQIAKEMYGENWADFVIDIPSTMFTKFGLGEPINSPEPVDMSIMKTREELSKS